MQPPALDAPNIAKMSAPEIAAMGTRTLNWPYLSASKLGTVRPKIEPALRIASC